MILFRKILAYPLSPETRDVFTYLDGVTTQQLDPPSLHPHTFRPETHVVMHSILRRCQEALDTASGTQFISTPELNEIPFSLAALCSQQEWEREKSMIVRRRFKEAFINDRLPLSRAEIDAQLRGVLLQAPQYTSITLLSHSFRLKLLQGFILTRGRLCAHPEEIHRVLDEQQKTFIWGEGFDATEEEIRVACST